MQMQNRKINIYESLNNCLYRRSKSGNDHDISSKFAEEIVTEIDIKSAVSISLCLARSYDTVFDISIMKTAQNIRVKNGLISITQTDIFFYQCCPIYQLRWCFNLVSLILQKHDSPLRQQHPREKCSIESKGAGFSLPKVDW